MIVQDGQLNLNAQIVPNLIVQIVPPSWTLINGVPTNLVGVVGTATWGAVNSPVIASGVADTTLSFGPMQARKYDLGTAVAAIALQGGQAGLRLVRVTDGTDVAAAGHFYQAGVGSAAPQAGGTGYAVNDTVTLAGGAILTVTAVNSGAITTVDVTTAGTYATPPANPVAQTATSGSGTGATFNLTFPIGLTLTGIYTGSLGNGLQASIGQGSSSTSGAPTYKVLIGLPGRPVEIFDNIGGTGAALFTNMVSAINNGQSGLRGPSQLVIASAGTSVAAPQLQAVAFTGGTDGASGVDSSDLVGVDTIPRKGMYALRGSGVGIGMLTDADDSTHWTDQVAFGLSEEVYMIAVSPAGDTISDFTSTIQSAGIDSYAIKLLFGDWVYINDNVNGVLRLVSPQGFIAGILGNLSPEQSSLNKPLQGIVGTQKSYANQYYSDAELQALAQARADVITNPVPGGSYFGARFGRNTSSSVVVHGDNYTRMTNFLAKTFNAGMGIYIGKLISPTLMGQAGDTLDSFCFNLSLPTAPGSPGMIADWKVVCDITNNPISRTALGIMQADVQVQYLAINETFIVNLQGGQSVVIQRAATQPLNG